MTIMANRAVQNAGTMVLSGFIVFNTVRFSLLDWLMGLSLRKALAFPRHVRLPGIHLGPSDQGGNPWLE